MPTAHGHVTSEGHGNAGFVQSGALNLEASAGDVSRATRSDASLGVTRSLQTTLERHLKETLLCDSHAAVFK
jgi:hypothetical protein